MRRIQSILDHVVISPRHASYRLDLSRKAVSCPKRYSTTPPPSLVLAPRRKKPTTNPFATAFAVSALAIAAWIFTSPIVNAEAPSPSPDKSERRVFRFSEVQKHDRNASEKWVTKGSKVYDITDWIPGHPGGEVILRACGGAVDPYWDIFAIHQKQEVYDILEDFCIGHVDPRDLVDGKVATDQIEDPFQHDPQRDKRLVVHSERPFNAETPPEGLENFLTPKETFYVRHHMWVPEVDSSEYRLVIELPAGDEKEYSMNDLRHKFKPVTITATLQCSGNRRNHMNEGAQRATNGLPWKFGGISNAEWTGVRLCDVLKDAGFTPDDPANEEIKHAQFTGAEAYGASIPIDKAVAKTGDVILAFAMNNQPLPKDHGFPLRLISPGTVAARSVKWLKRIALSVDESPSQWQQRDYKCFGPNVPGNPDWTTAPAIQDMPVQSAITSIRGPAKQSKQDCKLLDENGLDKDKNSIIAEGYGFAGGGRRIIRVDVSSDGGKTWHQADLLPDEAQGAKSWAWKRWRWILPESEAGKCFVVKAIDEAYNTQPADHHSNWNFRGNLTSAWHRVEYRDD